MTYTNIFTFISSVDVIWQSCEEARLAGATGNSLNVREVPVECKTIKSPAVETLKIQNNAKQSCNHSDCTWFNVTYTNSVGMDAVTKWMNADNRKCWQEIRFHCLGAPISDSQNVKRALWVDGRGSYPGFMTGNKTHWCQCAMYDTCMYPGKLTMNSMKLVIPLHSLYWSIHTKDESKRGTTFAFIFGVN